MPPFGANDPGPKFRSTSTDGDESTGPGFDEPDPHETKVAPEPFIQVAKRSFFGLGRFRLDSDGDTTSIEPEKKPIRCFECGHIHEVSIAASSTQCARCSLYISLSDQNIKGHYSRNIQTRGDVTIYRKGSVIGCEIACHNLTVLGKISGSVDCSGNATFKNSGKVLGSMHCKHIVVDRKCEMDFPQGIVAESADIYGVVRGDILCSGTIHIFKNGSVLGDASARAVDVKDGGVLTGQMRIQHDVDISLPEKGTVRPEQPELDSEKSASTSSEKIKKKEEKIEAKQNSPEKSSKSPQTKKNPSKNGEKAKGHKVKKGNKTRSKKDKRSDKEDEEPFELHP